MKNIYSSLIAAALGISGITTAYAVQTPNSYECIGMNAKVSLIVGNNKAEVSIWPAQTTLNLQVGNKSYSFQEEEIATESTLIGDLWEVTLDHIPDLHIDHATVVIPSIILGDYSPVRFKSQLILTRVETPFSQEASKGVVNSSKYIDLSCVASTLFF